MQRRRVIRWKAATWPEQTRVPVQDFQSVAEWIRRLLKPSRSGSMSYPKGMTMFTSIRKYTVKRGSVAEYARRVQEGFVPLLRQMEGFQAYYLLDGGSQDVLITISMFSSVDEAVASNVKAADWVRNNVLDLTKGMPEIMIGSALVSEVRE